MGSARGISRGIATVAAMVTATAAAQPAYARQTVAVPCSASALITAVNSANAFGSGTLVLASNCDYVLTAPSATGRGPDGLLITGRLNIIGGVSTRISRPASAAPFRVIEVASGASLLLRNVFVSGGLTDDTVPTNDTGGGILNSRGALTLDRVTLENDTADSGAGLSNDSGAVRLANTLVQNNATRAGGGGVYNDGTLTTTGSIIRLNRANTNGGGIYNGQGGRLLTFSTTIERNTAGGSGGGGIFNAADGQSILSRTLVRLNAATNGSGIFNAGMPSRMTPSVSVIRSNTPNNCNPGGAVPGCVG